MPNLTRWRLGFYHGSFFPGTFVSIERIRSLIARDMVAVDAVIREKLYSDVGLIRQVSEYIINSGGKRLRPALVILSAGAFGYSGKYQYESRGNRRVHSYRDPAA